MSKVSGAWTGITGCSAAAGCHALKRTAGDRDARRSPVGCSGTRRPVAGDDVAVGVGGGELDLQPLDRAVGVAHGAADGAGLAEDVPGLERLAELEVDAVDLDLAAEREAELGLRLEPVGAHVEAVLARGRASTSRKSSQTKCGSMKRSCSAVPQRVSGPVDRARARAARSAPGSAAAGRGSCAASGGISKPRNSTSPSRPVGPSGE